MKTKRSRADVRRDAALVRQFFPWLTRAQSAAFAKKYGWEYLGRTEDARENVRPKISRGK